jgi:hypothetical protein
MLAAIVVLGPIAFGQPFSLVATDGLGVNIHFTDPKPGEMKQIAGAGFKIVRMDFDWSAIEKEKGQYDFSAYDRLVKSCDEHGLRILFILDYVNKHYDDARSPDSDESRAAFARWAAEGVKRFKGRKILWEMYNEPNIYPFWRPKPNVHDYVKLALATAKAIKAVAPEEIQIGPATSGIDLPFLETCFKAGLLEYWSAVSVHPYRQQVPETANDDYRQLRLLIRKYAPKNKTIPILSGEWGYSSVWPGFDDDRQGKMLARLWLTNLMNDIPISIWYDWRDDGPDPKEPEHHFGAVKQDGTPKPAYVAAKTLTSQLAGYTYNKRLASSNRDEYVLLFNNGGQLKLVAWTTSAELLTARVPGSAKRYTVVSHLNNELPELTTRKGELLFPLTDSPVYITPEGHDAVLAAAAVVGRPALEVFVTRDQALSGFSIAGVNDSVYAPSAQQLREILAEKQKLRATRTRGTTGVPEPGAQLMVPGRTKSPIGSPPHRVLTHHLITNESDPVWFEQEMHICVTDPLSVYVYPRVRNVLPVRIDNPAGTAFKGRLAIHGAPGDPATLEPVELLPLQQQLNVLRNAPPSDRGGGYSACVTLFDDEGHALIKSPPRRRVPISVNVEHLTVGAEGDPKVASERSFRGVLAPHGLPADYVPAIRIDYRFDPGWKYICLHPKEDRQAVTGEPTHLALWVKGDGSGNITRMRFVDSTGQTFQTDGNRLLDLEWKYVEFPLDASHGGHWGGANDGRIHYPIRLDTILLIDSAARQKTGGTVFLSSPTLIYQE